MALDKITEFLERRLNLIEDKDVGLVMPSSTGQGSDLSNYLSVVARVASSRNYSLITFKANIFNRLRHSLDLKHVMEGSPWFMDKHPILLCELLVGEDPETIDLNYMQIVVRVHNLPLYQRTKETAKCIGDQLGAFVEYMKPQNEFEHGLICIKRTLNIVPSYQQTRNPREEMTPILDKNPSQTKTCFHNSSTKQDPSSSISPNSTNPTNTDCPRVKIPTLILSAEIVMQSHRLQ
ncbi:hypothetical protein CDL12_12565 [Handroanthus impetiginosus]|uniref:Uncharacterized protein n=1 Tax=Handroanthus impetiginosus TaxID=429701 RepID=A0A2G9HBA1_9LAMI|nr:hypothetical protein CDL12_12565 [Handroanthus impetiginosus]